MYITIDTIDYVVYSIYDITKYGCVFLKLGESIYVEMDLIPILLGSLPLSAFTSMYLCSRVRVRVPDTVTF